jgi:hypothetical protein
MYNDEDTGNWVGPVVGLGMSAAGLYYVTKNWHTFGQISTPEHAKEFIKSAQSPNVNPPIKPNPNIKAVDIGPVFNRSSDAELLPDPYSTYKLAAVPPAIKPDRYQSAAYTENNPILQSVRDYETGFHQEQISRLKKFSKSQSRRSKMASLLYPSMSSTYLEAAKGPLKKFAPEPVGVKSLERLLESVNEGLSPGQKLMLSVSENPEGPRLQVWGEGGGRSSTKVELPLQLGETLLSNRGEVGLGGVILREGGKLRKVDFYEAVRAKFNVLRAQMRSRGKLALNAHETIATLRRAMSGYLKFATDMKERLGSRVPYKAVRSAHTVLVPELAERIQGWRRQKVPVDKMAENVHGWIASNLTGKGQLFEGVNPIDLAIYTGDNPVEGMLMSPTAGRLMHGISEPSRSDFNAFTKARAINYTKADVKRLNSMGIYPGLPDILPKEFDLLEKGVKARFGIQSPSFRTKALIVTSPGLQAQLGLGVPSTLGLTDEGAVLASRQLAEAASKSFQTSIRIPVGPSVVPTEIISQIMEEKITEPTRIKKGDILYKRGNKFTRAR